MMRSFERSFCTTLLTRRWFYEKPLLNCPSRLSASGLCNLVSTLTSCFIPTIVFSMRLLSAIDSFLCLNIWIIHSLGFHTKFMAILTLTHMPIFHSDMRVEVINWFGLVALEASLHD